MDSIDQVEDIQIQHVTPLLSRMDTLGREEEAIIVPCL
jgi:hypothetical protein